LSAFPKPTIVEVTPVTVPVKAGDLMALLNLMLLWHLKQLFKSLVSHFLIQPSLKYT
jgi:hypothetical protein